MLQPFPKISKEHNFQPGGHGPPDPMPLPTVSFHFRTKSFISVALLKTQRFDGPKQIPVN